MFNKTLFQQYQTSIALVLLSAYFFINGLINSTTVLMEAMRNPPLPFEQWEPFVWEYSSALGGFLIVILLSRLLLRYPFKWQQPLLSIGQYGVMIFVCSMAHILFMIASRKIVYFVMGREYDFAIGFSQWTFELAYELRKDIWSCAVFIIMIWAYRYMVAQWLGDAKDIKIDNQVHPSTDNQNKENNLLLIKKLGREFLINKSEIQWIEASGNYLNLHIGDNIFPMRATFKSFLEKNTHLPIKRVHRSYAVNLNYVDNISLTTSGDGTIELTSGQMVKMSRRFKIQLE